MPDTFLQLTFGLYRVTQRQSFVIKISLHQRVRHIALTYKSIEPFSSLKKNQGKVKREKERKKQTITKKKTNRNKVSCFPY